MDCSPTGVWALWWRRFRGIKAMDACTLGEQQANNGWMTEESIYR